MKLSGGYASVQEAIDALPASGGLVYLPAGSYDVASAITITKANVRLLGDGVGATILRPSSSNPTMHLLNINADFFSIEGVELDGRGTSAGNYDVIRVWNCKRTRIIRCYVKKARRHALRITSVIEFLAEDTVFDGNYGGTSDPATSYGVYAQLGSGSTDPVGSGVNNTHLRFTFCSFLANEGGGCWIDSGFGVTFDQCLFESNKGGTGTTDANGLKIEDVTNARIIDCHFEGAATGTPRAAQFLRVDRGNSLMLVSTTFYGSSDTAPYKKPTHAASIADSDLYFIGQNRCELMSVDGINTVSDCIGGVFLGSNTDANSKDVMGALRDTRIDFDYIRIPNVTTTQRDALTPINGMIVYNTTASLFQVREAGAWRTM